MPRSPPAATPVAGPPTGAATRAAREVTGRLLAALADRRRPIESAARRERRGTRAGEPGGHPARPDTVPEMDDR